MRSTDGYAGRLKQALKFGPRPMSVRDLARELQDGPYKGGRGTTYPSVRQYTEGRIKKRPRADLLRMYAETLGVRADWLVFDEGPMTEAQEAARAETSTAIAAATLSAMHGSSGVLVVGDLFQVSATPPPPNDPDASAAILAGLLERVEKALGIDHPEDTPYWAAPALRLRLSLTKAGVGGPDACEKIGLALAGPLDAFGVPAATLSPEKLDHYIFSMIPVLLTLAENRSKEDIDA